MANRGCTIVIKILGGSTGNGDVEDMSLPVALHSPLQVLKEQLMDIIGIPVQDQVLILCNLSDPDRNSDILLSGRDFDTLRTCGIRNGSTLTLHALGISAELKQHLTKQAMSAGKETRADPNEKPRITLSTTIGAADADHSYNGVIFDVASPGPFEVNLLSISIAGMLGRVRIYARDGPWEDDKPRKGPSPHWWAHRESVSPQGWELIADRTCRPSWDKPLEIPFDKPVKLLPHTCRALYCHSGLPDDLGIQYQSYKKNDIVAFDGHIEIRPGLGHTGSEPFDEQHGWYRAHRGPAGAVTYNVQRKGWTPFEHAIFPTPLRRAVVALLQCQNHDNYLASTATGSSSTNLVTNGATSSSSGGSEEQGGEEEEMVLKMSADDLPPTTTTHLQSPMQLNLPLPLCAPPRAHLPQRTAVQSRQQQCYASMAQLLNVCQGRRISGLPKFVIYNILEFMHWDWFEECYEDEWDAAPFSPTNSNSSSKAKKTPTARNRVTRNVLSALGLDGDVPPGQLSALHQLLLQVGWMQGGGTAVMDGEEITHMFGSDDEEEDELDSDYEDMEEEGEDEEDEEGEDGEEEDADWEEEGEWIEDSEDEAEEEAMMQALHQATEEGEGEQSEESGDSDESDDENLQAESHSDNGSDEESDNSAMDVATGHHSDSGDEAENEDRLNESEDDDSAGSGGYHSVSNSVGGSAGVNSESESDED
eukprot:gene9037-10673_t